MTKVNNGSFHRCQRNELIQARLDYIKGRLIGKLLSCGQVHWPQGPNTREFTTGRGEEREKEREKEHAHTERKERGGEG